MKCFVDGGLTIGRKNLKLTSVRRQLDGMDFREAKFLQAVKEGRDVFLGKFMCELHSKKETFYVVVNVTKHPFQFIKR